MQQKISNLISEGEKYHFSNNCYTNHYGTYGRVSVEMQSWVADVEDFIFLNYGEDSSPWRLFKKYYEESIDGNYEESFLKQKRYVTSSLLACQRIEPKKKSENIDALLFLKNLFEKFHLIARQMRQRYDNRNTLDINDEYDVQDLLHALLRIRFLDIRNEEWTPSYAGGSARMDFLLKEEEIVIEVKKTRKGLGDRELGIQLIEDRDKYKTHPSCKKLICFVYDPDGRINNPKGIQNDLNKESDEFEVEIIIKP